MNDGVSRSEAPLAASSKRQVRVKYLLAVMAIISVGAVAVGTASARADGAFCPASGTLGLAAYGSANNTDRCAWAYHNNIGGVEYWNFATSTTKCAVTKPNSNGSGGNVGGIIDCEPGIGTVAIAAYDSWVEGYATGINQSANYHTGFQGWLVFHFS